MKKYVFDIEANGLLPTISKYHCGGIIDADTGEEWWYRPNQYKEFLDKLDEADIIVAHNAYGYDVPALTKLFGWYPKARVHCTKVMSQVLNYCRFPSKRHSLAEWGKFFKDNKGDYNGGWEEFNEEMFVYMQQDVRLGVKVYNYLLREFAEQASTKPMIKRALQVEMKMDELMVQQCQNGWLIDMDKYEALLIEISGKMKEIEDRVNPQIKLKIKAKDGKDDAKKPSYTKAGILMAPHRNWFGLPADTTIDDCPIWGEYCRVDTIQPDIGSMDSVKDHLYNLGWKPDDWNWKKINGQFIKQSPKLTSSSLLPLGQIGEDLDRYYTLRSRKSILEGWKEHIDDNNRLHGDVFNIGTPTFRQTHKIIANLPSPKAEYGKEVRELFTVPKGRKLVSADSAACQLRILAHYMKDDDFTHQVLHGDIHQANADKVGITRAQAKPMIFAILFGAGGKKVAKILGCSDKEGTAARSKFLAGWPKLKGLIDRLNTIWAQTYTRFGQGWIPGPDGRRIYPEDAFKGLNYIIQGTEAIIMKYTLVKAMEDLEAANIDANLLLFYHDEFTVEVPEEKAEEAQAIITKAFSEAPKEVGLDIMECGDCNIGNDYLEVH